MNEWNQCVTCCFFLLNVKLVSMFSSVFATSGPKIPIPLLTIEKSKIALQLVLSQVNDVCIVK